ncbi:DNA-binding protein [Phormidesmis priestleyi ULC007]|uniref:DNA-binding protein n=1 Tax=Phormidesmis priestleyi ULC007 TaxID=1920490 RepID=A0A2T1DDA5_9CYAN|nr:helix-turn-helix domain-containing protein [Phormidesmis priestleyi]PSB18433.1 DNA-binding protein [Phormidesmis priestleyi ULC007]PZO48840.1 MAG: DNA-binding protein [Phormidesmis priestleyi]
MDQVFLEKYLFKPKRVISDEQFARLITTQQFAKQFYIHETTAYSWAQVGKVWATKIGRRWYFDPLSVAEDKS